jgi:hypothetical protein
MSYYLLLNSEQKGPYTIGQLRAMWRSGAVTSDTQYWEDGLTEWLPVSTLADQLDAPEPQSRPLQQLYTAPSGRKCPHCGSHQVGKVRGLQGFGEVVIFIILFCCFLIPGFIYYIYIESVPYCSGCGRRL